MLASEGRKHHVDLRQRPAPAAQFNVNRAMESGRLGIHPASGEAHLSENLLFGLAARLLERPVQLICWMVSP